MQQIVLRYFLSYLSNYPKINTFLLTGGNSKNGHEYHLRQLLKKQNIKLAIIETKTSKIHSFNYENRIIKVVLLTAPTGTANRAVGSNSQYKLLKQQNPKFNMFDFRVLQHEKFF